MALVRCSCVVGLVLPPSGAREVDVSVLDPHCDYVVHRLGAELAAGPAPGGVRH